MSQFFLLRLSLFFLLMATSAFAQVGINTSTPHPSSVLDVESNSQGMLTPRMTSAQRNGISNPANGLLVYDTDALAFFYYNNTNWIKLKSPVDNSLYSGWAEYRDGAYTSANPIEINKNTKYTLPNNANISNESQLPIDIPTFYDASTSKILGKDGDALNVVIEFKARPTAGSFARLSVSLDIGGAVGEIYPRDFSMAKGKNEEHYYLSSFQVFTLNTWSTNGAKIKVSCTEDTEIYDIRYVISRTHKAR